MNRRTRSYSRGRRGKRIKRVFFVALAAFLMFCIGLGIGAFVVLDDIFVNGPADDVSSDGEETKDNVDKNIINVLFLGIDGWGKGSANLSGGGNHRTDTMILASFNKKTKRLDLISVPRDTRVSIEGSPRPHDKINAAFVYGGPELACATVEDLLNVEIPYYVVTNYAGFRRIVDIIGGVDYNVEKRMYYPDPYQDLLIDLQKGYQHLDGAKAEQYVRYRADGLGDIGRIERQQKFIKAVIDKMLRPSMIPKLPTIAGEMTDYIRTNIPPTKMMSLVLSGKSVDKESIETYRLPGTDGTIGGASYWLPDHVKIQQTIDDIYNGEQAESNKPVQVSKKVDINQITVEIQNGNGRKGQAAVLQKRLEKQGYQIKEVGNADHFYYPKSRIYYKPGLKKTADSLESVVGSADLIEDHKIDRDVIIVIGENYTG